MAFSITQVDHANGFQEWALRRESDGAVCVFEEASRQDVQETAELIASGDEDEEDYF